MLSLTSRKSIHERSDSSFKYRTRMTKYPLKYLDPLDTNRNSTSVISTSKVKYKVSPNIASEKINGSNLKFYKFSHKIYKAKCKDLHIVLVNEQEKRFFTSFQQNAEQRKLLLSDNNLSINSSTVLSKILSTYFDFTYIDLSKNKLGDSGIKNIVQALLSNKDIVHLDISSNDISQPGMSEIIFFLSKHSSLYSLDLSSHQFLYRNKVGVCENFYKLLKCPTLVHLNLSGTSLGSEGLKYVIVGLENNKSLSYLNIGNNSIKSNIIKEFVQVLITSKVNNLNLENNILDELAADEFSFFFTGLYGYGEINKLNLAGNYLTTSGIFKIFEALIKDNCLEQIIMDRNSFIGYLDIFERLLGENRKLKYLSLSNCGLKIEAFCRLCEGLRCNQLLETLILSGNSCKDIGAVTIAKALQYNNSLQKLDLSSNMIKSEGGISLALALRYNKRLKSLILNDNELKDDVGEAFYQLFGSNYSIIKLHFQLNPMNAKYALEIQKYLERNKNYLYKNEITKIIQSKETLIIPKETLEIINQKIVKNKQLAENIQQKIGTYSKKITIIKANGEEKLEELKQVFNVYREKNDNLSKVLYEIQLEIKVSLYLACNIKWAKIIKRTWN